MAIMSNDFLPFLAMVIVQMGYAVMNVLVKLVLDSGMSPLVLVAYRQVFATIPIAPLAYFLERATTNQLFYFVGLKYSTPTIGCALSNILPAVTFVLAVVCKQETIGLNKKQGQAKVLGTTLCVGGAMLLSFYHGRTIGIGEPSIHLHSSGQTSTTSNSNNSHNNGNMFLGPSLLLASCVAWAGWLIIQARLSEKFAAPYTSTALMCLMACIECVLIAVCFQHNVSAWSLASGIKLVSSIYAGFVGSALACCLMTWCIQRKGALYVSVFSPLLLIIVAILSWALLDEKLYVGTIVGSTLIILGLYAVLWGVNKESEERNNGIIKEAEKDEDNQDLELQSNGKNYTTDFKEDHFIQPI
ncbi:EamA domain [Dillenia turbinata]|uniref:WAT1-related protein n=1 Tax=Dillenia turbinata TaxID=194707 RepID=A0AAN8UTK6_9MAGN